MRESHVGILGGDKRQTYIANYLAAKGYEVSVYGVDKKGLSKSVREAESLEEFLHHNRRIIGPVPFTREEISIAGGSKETTVEDFLTLAAEDTFLFAGCLSELILRQCEGRGIRCYDYMKNDRVAIYNSIATAEGTILELLANHPGNIHASKCLITGYGRCARTLADKLQGLRAEVTICARRERDREEAATHGFKSIDFGELRQHICEFEYIINTVPALVLPADIVALVCHDSLLVDIASVPGGVDFQTAKKLGIQTIHALGLPGKYAPKASAKLLADIFEDLL